MDIKTIAKFAGISLVVSLVVSFVISPEQVTNVIDRTVTNDIVGVASPDVHSYMNVHGKFREGGGVTSITDADGTVTLTFDNMVDSKIIRFTDPLASASTTNATLPASTTFPLPNSGDYGTWVIENAYTATTTTIVAGTGIDLQEPDGQNVVISANNYAWLTCFREASTDVVCRVDETIPAD